MTLNGSDSVLLKKGSVISKIAMTSKSVDECSQVEYLKSGYAIIDNSRRIK